MAVAATIALPLLPTVANAAETEWTVRSPDNSVSADISLASGSLTLEVRKGSSSVLTVTKLGVVTSAANLSQGISITSTSTNSITESYSMLAGKQHHRSAVHNELVLNATANGHNFVTRVRASDDGIAYSYDLPASLGASYTVTSEPARFQLNPTAPAWLQSFAPWYENEHQVTTVGGAGTGTFGYPATFRPTSDTYVLLSDSGVSGKYIGAHLTHSSGASDFGLEFYQNAAVNASGALSTPWRVAIVGTAADLVSSTLIDDLAPDQRVEDTSWIKTGVSAWAWNTNRDGAAMSSLAVQKRFVDMAYKHGWTQYVIDEGWQESWVPELIQYANARGVEINVWFHSNRLWTKDQRIEWFSKLKQWGANGIKVDFMESDSQATFQWYDDILKETAEYHLTVNFHGSTIPRGWQRTWPQIMSYEGVRGEENGRSAVRDTILPFTRNVVGSMDFTPTVFSNNTNTSKAHEVGEAIVFESGVQHLADDTSSYANEPIATKFLEQLEVSWDETRLVQGTPGTDAVLARRNGDRWFIGGVWAASPNSTRTVPLDFLGAGNWIVDLVTDSGSSLAAQTLTATSASSLSVNSINNGGFAALACPETPGRTSCLSAPGPIVPASMLTTASKTEVAPGEIVTVSSTFTAGPGGPVTNVKVSPNTPANWTLISGNKQSVVSLASGESINSTWRFRVGNSSNKETVNLGIAGEYTSPSGRIATAIGLSPIVVAPTIKPPQGTAYISDLPFTFTKTGYGSVMRDKDMNGNPINIGPDPTTYEKGITVHAIGEVRVYLGGACTTFSTTVGLEPGGSTASEGSVTFEIKGDGVSLATAGSNASPFRENTPGQAITISVAGVQELSLNVADGGNYINNDHGAFGNAVLHCQPGPAPDTTAPTVELSTAPAAPGPSGWFTSPVVATVTATDDGDEAPFVSIKVGNNGWDEYSAPVTINDGVHAVAAEAVDIAGNATTLPDRTIKVDTVAPVVTVAPDDSAGTLTIAATDETSGIASIEYKVGNGSWQQYTQTTVVPRGVIVRTRATDNAGNVALGDVIALSGGSGGGGDNGTSGTSTAAIVAPGSGVYGVAQSIAVRVSSNSASPSGTVRATLGGKVIAVAQLKSGRATVKLPSSLAVGRHQIAVSFVGTAALRQSSDVVAVAVAKAKVTSIKVSGKKYTRGKAPRVTVTVGKLTNGTYATGKLRVTVGKKTVRTVTLTAKKRGKVNVKLPVAKKRSIKVRVQFVASNTRQVTGVKSKTLKLKAR
ncbi:hypothetical protein GCM10010401_08030 [Rarobacter faecitabidus]